MLRGTFSTPLFISLAQVLFIFQSPKSTPLKTALKKNINLLDFFALDFFTFQSNLKINPTPTFYKRSKSRQPLLLNNSITSPFKRNIFFINLKRLQSLYRSGCVSVSGVCFIVGTRKELVLIVGVGELLKRRT